MVIGNTWAFPIHEDERFNGAKNFSLWMGGAKNKDKVINENIFLDIVTPLLRKGQDRRDPKLGDAVAAAYNAPWSKPEWRYPTWISPNQIARGVDYIIEVEKGLANLKDKPVLFFWGMKDTVCVPALYGKFSELFPDNRLVELPDANHFFQEDEPEIIVQEMQSFLEE
jgi:haloalkane dehalogenase